MNYLVYGHRPNIGYAKFPLDENTNLPLPQPDRPLLLTTFGQDSYREKLIIEAMDARGETANAICCKYTLYTTLHLASKTGDFTCVETLVHLGANVNMRAWDGSTPLMLAIVNGYDSIVRLLVGSGADPNLPALRHQHEAEGIRPIEEAVVRALLYPTVGARTIVKLLMWAGAKFDWDAPWVLPLRESVAYKIRVLLDNLDYDLKKEMDGLSRKSRVEIMYKLRTT